MKAPDPGWNRHDRRAALIERGLLLLLAVFTGTAILGFLLFAGVLAPIVSGAVLSKYPALASFYAVSYVFFARGHIVISALVLVVLLYRTSGWMWVTSAMFVAFFALAAELLGTVTGIPFGAYEYTGLLGPKIAGHVPVLIPISWVTMALPAYVLAQRILSRASVPARWLLGGWLLTTWDFSLDPAMSAFTNYWTWFETGSYYGAPLVNYAGWMLVSTVIMIGIDLLGGYRWSEKASGRQLGVYYLLVLSLPLGMTLAAGHLLPLAVTLGALSVPIALLIRAAKPAVSGHHVPEKVLAESPGSSVTEDGTEGFFWTHSRSFSFASLGFERSQRRLVELVYAFCRITDDLVDEQEDVGPHELKIKLEDWLATARKAYRGEASGHPWLDTLMRTSAERGVPFQVIEDLVWGVGEDAQPLKIQTRRELLAYSYGVASTVGIWLCHLHGIRDEWMLERAASLGRAMQITNILRDVGEDFRRGRLYVPQQLLEQHGVSIADLEAMAGGAEPSRGYIEAMQDLMGLADEHYEAAWSAIPFLPRGFSSAAAVAATVYRGIHREIIRNGYDNFRRRAHTSTFRKVILASRALWRLGMSRVRTGLEPIGRPAAGLLIVMALTAPIEAGAQETNFSYLRDAYVAGVDDLHQIEQAESYLDSLLVPAADEPLALAFDAALEVLKAKHASWPFTKVRHLRNGLPTLDSLVVEHPDHSEIRFLRLVSTEPLPRVFGRNDTVRDDLAVLCNLLPSVQEAYDDEWYGRMLHFVLEKGHMEPSERDHLQDLLDRTGYVHESG